MRPEYRWLISGCLWAVAAVAPATELPPAAAVAAAHPLATQAGMEVLGEGGNAFDAAVAIAATLAVVEPFNSGLGGGGFFLLHRAADGRDVVIDARETAPLAATPAMYLDLQGQPKARASLDGALAAGIPGTPAAFEHLAARYGRLPLSRTLAPAIRHAREGYAVGSHYRLRAESRLEALSASPASAATFLVAGAAPAVGYVLRQPELAATLERIAAQGERGFYSGHIARRLVDGVRAAGGIWRAEDLEKYRVIEREPIVGEYRGVRIVSVPPPSSGGTVLVETLNILHGFDLQAMDRIARKHVIVESLRRSYADRAAHLGDPAFAAAPLERLLSPAYAAQWRATIDPDRATPSRGLNAAPAEATGTDTTHFSILDAEGNRVAATLSINLPFGSGYMPPGTGVLLNNEMDDFVTAPDRPNAYGLVGSRANAIEPEKRPLSSMTPTFLESADRVAVLGTPGGSRIISMVLLAALEFTQGGTPEAWLALPRYHHQYLPDVIEFEPGALTDIEQAGLRRRGHAVRVLERTYGNMQAILWDKAGDRVLAASDPRGEGAARVVVRNEPELWQSTDH